MNYGRGGAGVRGIPVEESTSQHPIHRMRDFRDPAVAHSARPTIGWSDSGWARAWGTACDDLGEEPSRSRFAAYGDPKYCGACEYKNLVTHEISIANNTMRVIYIFVCFCEHVSLPRLRETYGVYQIRYSYCSFTNSITSRCTDLCFEWNLLWFCQKICPEPKKFRPTANVIQQNHQDLWKRWGREAGIKRNYCCFCISLRVIPLNLKRAAGTTSQNFTRKLGLDCWRKDGEVHWPANNFWLLPEGRRSPLPRQ